MSSCVRIIIIDFSFSLYIHVLAFSGLYTVSYYVAIIVHVYYIHFLDKSYPIEVLHYLKMLTIDKSLRKFATFIGFTEEELDEIESHSPDTQEQIKTFSKVWRMPDLTERKNNEVLCMVMRKAGINIGTCIYNE